MAIPISRALNKRQIEKLSGAAFLADDAVLCIITVPMTRVKQLPSAFGPRIAAVRGNGCRRAWHSGRARK